MAILSPSTAKFIQIAILALGLVGGSSMAEEFERGHRAGEPRFELDQRYHHDHYYPQRGYAMPVLPHESVSIQFGGGQYFFHSGVWFRPMGGRFVVTLPPVGIAIPVLPPTATQVLINGVPYYYANGTYYALAPGQGYAVVVPPSNPEGAQVVPPPQVVPVAPDPVIYPRNGQTAIQTESDRKACNTWATTQPTAMVDAAVFSRAIAACMDGRGYSIR